MRGTWSILLVLAVLAVAGWGAKQAWSADVVPMAPAVATPAAPAGGPHAEPAAAPAASEAASRVEAVLVPGRAAVACVDVRVEQAGGAPARPLPFVDVVLRTDGLELTARTDANGEVEFECAGGDGHAASVRCALGGHAEVTLSAMHAQPVVLRIVPHLLVRGRVTDAGGAPVAGATIVLLPGDTAAEAPPAPASVGASDANGDYAVGLGLGGRIGAQHRDHGSTAMYLVRAPAEALAPLPVATVPLAFLGMAGQVQGTVRSADGAPVAGAELEFRSAAKAPADAELAAVPQRVRSDADGRFAVGRLRPGAIAFAARARGHGPCTGTLQLAAGATLGFDVELTRPCTLTGSVRTPADGTVPARVTVGTAGGFASRSVRTQADGSFRLDDLAPGPNPAIATPLDDGRAYTPVSTTLDLHADAANEWLAVLGDGGPAPNLRGRLRDARGGPLAGWRIVPRVPGGKPTLAVSDADGAFALRVPAAGRTDLRAYAPGRSPLAFANAVLRDVAPAAQPIDFVVAPPPPSRLLARVVSRDGTPLAATISCWHHERAEVRAVDGHRRRPRAARRRAAGHHRPAVRTRRPGQCGAARARADQRGHARSRRRPARRRRLVERLGAWTGRHRARGLRARVAGAGRRRPAAAVLRDLQQRRLPLPDDARRPARAAGARRRPRRRALRGHGRGRHREAPGRRAAVRRHPAPAHRGAAGGAVRDRRHVPHAGAGRPVAVDRSRRRRARHGARGPGHGLPAAGQLRGGGMGVRQLAVADDDGVRRRQRRRGAARARAPRCTAVTATKLRQPGAR
ncbi:MAG: carboxypeptidase-like regulatory domain-containing protein [Pirellulales bacterium]